MTPSSLMAIKYIKSKKYSFLPSLSFLTSFFGIFISVFALISIISIMEGFKKEFENNIVGLRPHVKVYFLDDNYSIKEFDDYTNKKKLLSGISKSVSGGISGQAIVSNESGGRLSGVIVNSLDIDGFYSRSLLQNGIVGEFKKDEIVIGKELAFSLNVNVGDKINLISPQFRSTPFGNIPIHKTYTVSGIFDVGMYLYNSSFVFLELSQGELFFQKGGAEYLELIVDDFNNLNPIKDKIKNIFNTQIRVVDWKSENQGFIDAINLQKSAMFFILFMFLILASFVMFSGLSSLVMQKNKTTAILRIMGFSKMQIVLTFFQVGMFTALPSIFFGTLFGCFFILNLERFKNWLEDVFNTNLFDGAYYFLSYIPSYIDFMTVFQVVIISILLSTVSIIIPSIRAIKTKPIDALRWE